MEASGDSKRYEIMMCSGYFLIALPSINNVIAAIFQNRFNSPWIPLYAKYYDWVLTFAHVFPVLGALGITLMLMRQNTGWLLAALGLVSEISTFVYYLVLDSSSQSSSIFPKERFSAILFFSRYFIIVLLLIMLFAPAARKRYVVGLVKIITVVILSFLPVLIRANAFEISICISSHL